MTLFKNKYRIEPARLKHFDYGSNAAYYVTICTKNKINCFGEIVEPDNYLAPRQQNLETDNYPSFIPQNLETDNYPSLRATQIGNIATEYWQQIPQHFPFVLLDEFIVMPNHFHGILIINKPLVETDNNLSPQEWNPNQFGSQSQNLASIIRGYKASVKRFANLNNIPFEWQPKYWERVIRDENELIIIRNYINLNPGNWLNDEHYCRAT